MVSIAFIVVLSFSCYLRASSFRSTRTTPKFSFRQQIDASISPAEASQPMATDFNPLHDNIRWIEFSSSISSKKFKVAEVKDVDVVFDYSIKNNLPEAFGIQVWDGAYILAIFIESFFKRDPVAHSAKLRSLRVVDLGCGNGLASLLCASYGISALALDFNKYSLELTDIGYQRLRGDCADPNSLGSVTCQLFDMAEDSQALPPCDLVLLSDVLYSNHISQLVAHRVFEAVTVHDATIIITDPGRSTVPVFIAELEKLMKNSSMNASFGMQDIVFKKIDRSKYGNKGQYLCLNDKLDIAGGV